MNILQSIGISLIALGLGIANHDFGWLLGMLVIGGGCGFVLGGYNNE